MNKYTIKPVTNDRALNAKSIRFTPFDLTSGKSVTEVLWGNARGLGRGNGTETASGKYEAVTAIKPLPIYRAALLTANIARENGARVSGIVVSILSFGSLATAARATDKAREELNEKRAEVAALRKFLNERRALRELSSLVDKDEGEEASAAAAELSEGERANLERLVLLETAAANLAEVLKSCVKTETTLNARYIEGLTTWTDKYITLGDKTAARDYFASFEETYKDALAQGHTENDALAIAVKLVK